MTRPPSRTTSYRANPGEPAADDDPLLAFAPVPHKQRKKNCIGPERQKKFIAALAASGIVSAAARSIGATPEALYGLRNKAGGEQFRAAWDTAVDRAIDRVEDGALERAIDGVERPVVSGGKLLGTYRHHNEALVMFLLRQRRPERYGEAFAAALRPGHPVYERIAKEVIAEYRRGALKRESINIASINAKIDAMRAREEEADRMLAELAKDRDGEIAP